ETIVADGLTGEAVAPAADRDGEAAGAAELEGALHVGRTRAPRNRGRAAVDRGVPNGAGVVVALVVREAEATPEARAQSDKVRGRHPALSLVSPDHVKGNRGADPHRHELGPTYTTGRLPGRHPLPFV